MQEQTNLPNTRRINVEVTGTGLIGSVLKPLLLFRTAMRNAISAISSFGFGGEITITSHPNDPDLKSTIESALSLKPSIVVVYQIGSASSSYAPQLTLVDGPNGYPFRVSYFPGGFALVHDWTASVTLISSVTEQRDNYTWRVNQHLQAVVFSLGSERFLIPCHLAAALRAKAGKVKILTASDIIRWLNEVKYVPELHLQIVAPILADWLGGEMHTGLVHYMYPTCLPGSIAESTGKPSAHMVEDNPLGLLSYAPVVNESASLAAVHHRINKVHNTATPDHYSGFAREFVDLMVVGTDPGPPLTEGEVLEIQDKPIQKQRNAAAVVQTAPYKHVHVTAFVKKEAYPAGKEPRNISNVMTKHNVELSRYTYAFKRGVLAYQHWYMPAKSMIEIAKRLRLFVSDSGYPVVETDFSRFDGTISRWLREHVEIAAYRRFYPEAADLLVLELDAKAETTEGYQYEVDGSRLSGSPATTDGNTMIAAFVDYVAARIIGLAPRDAYASIGLHFGDDGVSRPFPNLEAVASEMGLKLKCITRHDFVGFLGRIYPDPLLCLGSFQDPIRSWSKLTVLAGPASSASLPRLKAKYQSYLRSDSNTPFLGDYLRNWLSANSDIVAEEHEADIPFLHRGGHEWPQLTMVAAAEDYILRQLDMTASEVIESLTGTRTVWKEPVLEPGAEFTEGFNEGAAITISPVVTLNNSGLVNPGKRSQRRRAVQRARRASKPDVVTPHF